MVVPISLQEPPRRPAGNRPSARPAVCVDPSGTPGMAPRHPRSVPGTPDVRADNPIRSRVALPVSRSVSYGRTSTRPMTAACIEPALETEAPQDPEAAPELRAREGPEADA